jgi:hypothetical protein
LGANIFFFLPFCLFAHQEPVRGVTPSNSSDYESPSDEDYPDPNGYDHYGLSYQYQRPVVQQVHSLTSPLVDFPATTIAPPYILPHDHQILDEIVDELFLSRPENEELIMDFVNVWWDPAAASFGGDGALTDDVQLGNILDKLLEE